MGDWTIGGGRSPVHAAIRRGLTYRLAHLTEITDTSLAVLAWQIVGEVTAGMHSTDGWQPATARQVELVLRDAADVLVAAAGSATPWAVEGIDAVVDHLLVVVQQASHNHP